MTGEQRDRAGPGTLALRAFLTVLVVAMVVLWVYAFFLAPSGNPDRLEDRSWPAAAEARCLAARAALAAPGDVADGNALPVFDPAPAGEQVATVLPARSTRRTDGTQDVRRQGASTRRLSMEGR